MRQVNNNYKMVNLQTLIGLITLLPRILKDLDDPVGVAQVKPKDP